MELLTYFNQTNNIKKEIICSIKIFSIILVLYANYKKKLQNINFTIDIKYNKNIRKILNSTNYDEDCYDNGHNNVNLEKYVKHEISFIEIFNKQKQKELLELYAYEDFEDFEKELFNSIQNKYNKFGKYNLKIKINNVKMYCIYVGGFKQWEIKKET